MIVFTGFVILPLIQLARLILAGGELPYDGAVVRALGELVGGRRMTAGGRPRGLRAGDRRRLVVIDVMRDVWNHDAAALRLERLAARSDRAPAARLPAGGRRHRRGRARAARARALERAPFPAALVVWRGDQRPEDLAGAFEALNERVTALAP